MSPFTRRAIASGLPWPGRVREFKRLLEHLDEVEMPDISVPELRMQLRTICGAWSFWTAMADRMLKEVEGDTGAHPCAVTDVIEAVHQGLADHTRSHILGDGVLVGTVHAAKGLEFAHVVVLGGGWRKQNRCDGSSEAERRLYYVAMTRARETLTLLNRRDDPIPYLEELRRPGLVRRRVGVAHNESDRLGDVRYTVLGMRDLYIDFAGAKSEKDLIHRSLARMQVGDSVELKRGGNGQVRVLDGEGNEVARLSKSAALSWRQPQLQGMDEVRVLGLVSRHMEDCAPEYRERIAVPTWEVPILEVRHRRLHPSMERVPDSDPTFSRGDSVRVRTGYASTPCEGE